MKVQLVVDSINGSGWKQAKVWLLQTSATCVLAQEHKMVESEWSVASAWAKARGWQSLWTSALALDGEGTRSRSGGCALFVRSDFGLIRGIQVEGVAISTMGLLGPALKDTSLAWADKAGHIWT